MHPQLDDFMAIFDGYRETYGAYVLPQKEGAPGEKLTGKAATLSKPLTKEVWDAHLRGKQGLGIIPITRNSTAKFGAIDIDDYSIDVPGVLKAIQDFPLIPCRTKSGGLHLYLLMKEHVLAKDIVDKLHEIAGHLGYGTCEIFPRQTQILAERGDLGNWINLPYFNAHATTRYALNPDGTAMTIDKFVKRAYEMQLTPDQLAALKMPIQDLLPGGPPCLQKLIMQGFPPGTRNNGLFNLGVYALKSAPAEWERVVEDMNQKYMKPPLTSEEVLGVIKSLRRKDYAYTCKAQPIQSYCNATVCRTCKHGIGGADLGMPRLGSLTKLCTSPPIWFVDVQSEANSIGFRIELSTEELQSPQGFQMRCMEVANMMPQIMKRDQWHALVQQLMQTVTCIEPPKGTSPDEQLMSHLDHFCTGRVQARSKDEILLGKPFTQDGHIEFRFEDFMRYLERASFKIEVNRLTNVIRSIPGFDHKFRNIKGKGITVWMVPAKTFSKQEEPFDTPTQDAGPI